jgi:hypothetical protein
MAVATKRLTEVYGEIGTIIKAADDDKITAAAVLDFAKENPKSHTYAWLESHGAFDPDRAMEKWGLALCRRLIVKVKITLVNKDNEPVRVRAYTSLESDRTLGGGYRDTGKVLAEKAFRDEMLRTALKELKAFQRKYVALTELAPVFEAVGKVAS